MNIGGLVSSGEHQVGGPGGPGRLPWTGAPHRADWAALPLHSIPGGGGSWAPERRSAGKPHEQQAALWLCFWLWLKGVG